MKKIIVLLSCFLCFMNLVIAQDNITPVFQIDNDTAATYKMPKTAVSFFVDTIGNKDLNYLLKNPQLLRKVDNHTKHIQVVNAIRNYWTVFDIENITDNPIEILININSAGKNYYYLLDTAQKIIHQDISGGLAAWNEKKGFKISQEVVFILQAKQKYKMVIHHFKLWQVKQYTRIEFPIIIENAKQKYKNYYFEQTSTKTGFLTTYFAGFAVGIIFVMVFYNLFIYFSVGDRSYLYYVAFLVPTGLYFMHQQDLMSIILLPNSPIFIKYLRPHYIFVIFIFFIRFTQSLLTTKQLFPRWHKWLIGLLILECLMHFCNVVNMYVGTPEFASTLYKISDILLVVIVISCIATSVVAIIAKYSPAKYYLLACSFSAIGTITFIISQSIGEADVIAKYFMQGGAITMIVLFSLSLSDRINLMKKEIAQKELEKESQRRQIMEQQTSLLEEQVRIRTLELQDTNNNLNRTLTTIEKQHDSIISSINYALRIQNAIIPKEQEIQKYFPESFVLFRPKDIVSGDFYWFADKITETGNKKIIVVADCTGHGVSGAFMTMIGNNILNQIVYDQEIIQPNEILNLMTPLLEKTLLHSEGKVKDGMDISIVAITPAPPLLGGEIGDIEDVKNSPPRRGGAGGGVTIEYAGAMNPLYYIENQEFKEIKADKVPIGGKQKEGFSYQLFQLSVNSNQLLDDKKPITDNCSLITVYLCTDGFQDQFGGENNKKFMVKNLKKLLFEISDKPMAEQKQVLETTFDNWKGNQEQTDDVLVVGLKI
jgi:serine phosphatase RsbU (regulator of sigma subunit)